MGGRDYVIPEDVKQVAVPALAHRITLRPEMWLRRIDPRQVVTEVLGQTPVPATGALPTYGGEAPSRAGSAAPATGAAPDPYRYTARPRGDR
jgi:MoxR-like ATPase